MRTIKLITEAEDIYLEIDDAEDPDVIVYGKAAFVWSHVAFAYMERRSLFIEEKP